MPKHKKTDTARTVYRTKITGRNNKPVTKSEKDIVKNSRAITKEEETRKFRKATAEGYEGPTTKKRRLKIEAAKKRVKGRNSVRK